MRKNEKYIVPVGTIITGLFFAIYSYTHYDFLSPVQGPMQGFMPTILGVLLVFCGILAFIQVGHEENKEMNPHNWTIAAAMGIVIVFNYIIGTLPSILIFLLLWLKFVSRYDWKKTIFIFLIVAAFIICVFKLWMDIPFTNGILFDTLLE